MKLTKGMREDIERAIIAKKVTSLINENKQNAVNQTLLYVEELLKPYKKFIDSDPGGFLYRIDQLYMCFGQAYEEKVHIKLDKSIVVPYSWKKDNSYIYIYPHEDKWKKIFSDIYKQDKYISKYKCDLSHELRSVLYSCSTTGKLIKVFPEVVEYIPVCQLEFFPPVVQTDKLLSLLKEN